MQQRRSSFLKHKTLYLVGLLAAVAILVWWAVFTLPDGKTHLVFFDVGQGDAIFVQSPSGHQVLVDGGPDPSVITSALGREMPFWDHSLDLIVLTHPNDDHLAGLLAVIQRYEVGQVVDTGFEEKSSAYTQWQRTIKEKGLLYHQARRGEEIDLGDGVRLSVLHPQYLTSDVNDSSVVLRLTAGPFNALLTGDLGEKGEKDLLASGLDLASVILKVPHHGGKDSLASGFLAAVHPETAVISVGKNNRYGHPFPSTLAQLSGLEVLRTDEKGTIRIVTDGGTYTVSTSH